MSEAIESAELLERIPTQITEAATVLAAHLSVLRSSKAAHAKPLSWYRPYYNGEKTEDRKMLEYLMQQFNSEEWNCERCGWSEGTSECDSADILRRYLAGDKILLASAK